MRIFVSYASEDERLAERLDHALLGAGHDVFFAPSSLRAAEGYREKIRKEIENCKLFIFIVSPHSLEAGGYARFELSVAQELWRVARGHVLPVMAAEVPYEDLPPYLGELTMRAPAGDLVADVEWRVARITASRPIEWIKHLLRGRLAFALSLGFLLLLAPWLVVSVLDAGPIWPESPTGVAAVGAAAAAVGLLAVLVLSRLGGGVPRVVFAVVWLLLTVFALYQYTRNVVDHVEGIPAGDEISGRVLRLPSDEEHLIPSVYEKCRTLVDPGERGFESLEAVVHSFYSSKEYDPAFVWKAGYVDEARWSILWPWLLGFFGASGLAWTVLTQPPSRPPEPRSKAASA